MNDNVDGDAGPDMVVDVDWNLDEFLFVDADIGVYKDEDTNKDVAVCMDMDLHLELDLIVYLDADVNGYWDANLNVDHVVDFEQFICVDFTMDLMLKLMVPMTLI